MIGTLSFQKYADFHYISGITAANLTFNQFRHLREALECLKCDGNAAFAKPFHLMDNVNLDKREKSWKAFER